jgi:hypothetical protein
MRESSDQNPEEKKQTLQEEILNNETLKEMINEETNDDEEFDFDSLPQEEKGLISEKPKEEESKIYESKFENFIYRLKKNNFLRFLVSSIIGTIAFYFLYELIIEGTYLSFPKDNFFYIYRMSISWSIGYVISIWFQVKK